MVTQCVSKHIHYTQSFTKSQTYRQSDTHFDMEEKSETECETTFIDMLMSQIDEEGISAHIQHPCPVAEPLLERFAKPRSEEQIKIAQEGSVPATTKGATKWAIKLWKDWSASRKAASADSPPMPHVISLENLNGWLCKFVLEIRRKDGKDYTHQINFTAFVVESCDTFVSTVLRLIFLHSLNS